MQETFVSGEQARQLEKQYGLPLYVYSEKIIREKVAEILDAATGYHVAYAFKANTNSKIVSIIRDAGIKSVDVVSPGQIYKALSFGYKPHQIMYTQNFMDRQELEEALKFNVNLNIGALDTLRYFQKQLAGKQIFIRINPEKGAGENFNVITGGPASKFGISSQQLDEVLKISKNNNIKIVGLHQHIGSNLKLENLEVFLETTKFTFSKTKMFPDVRYVNIGGGVGIKYKQEEKLMDLKELFSEVTKIKDSYNDKLQIRIEPGRYIVGESGILLCRITARKQTTSEKQEDTRIFYGTNTGFTHLLRPALYKSHHEIFNLTGSTLPKEKAYICGNICESTDNLGNNIEISGEIGDILCIKNTGAYGFCMSSNYNERLRPAEVLINKEGQSVLIRRRETYEDLIEKI